MGWLVQRILSEKRLRFRNTRRIDPRQRCFKGQSCQEVLSSSAQERGSCVGFERNVLGRGFGKSRAHFGAFDNVCP